MENKTVQYYNTKTTSFIESTRDVDFSQTQEKFLNYIKESFANLKNKDLKLLDFGCGSGRDTKYFLSKSFSVDAIDGSREICIAASKYTGILELFKAGVGEDLIVLTRFNRQKFTIRCKESEVFMSVPYVAVAGTDLGIVKYHFKYGD